MAKSEAARPDPLPLRSARRGALRTTAGSLASLLTSACAVTPSAGDQPAPSNASIQVAPAAARTTSTGGPDWFTGTTHVEMLFAGTPPARVGGATVEFEPGARTHWHTHPLGQTLVVTAGTGWVQAWGQPAQVIQTGDVVQIPPHVKHWHGAASDSAMTHIAIQEALDGSPVDWMEPVTDSQYPD